METVTRPQKVAKSTDRIMEALSTLAALLERSINEVSTLDGEYQAQIKDAVRQKEEALRAEHAEYVELIRKEVLNELTSRSQGELQTALEMLRSDFQSERDRLRSEFESERERLSNELHAAGNTAAELQVERSKLSAELQRVKDHTAAEIERARSEASVATPVAPASSSSAPLPKEEIATVEKKLAEVIRIVEDPATELSVVIRKNVEKLELEAYLKGLRYAPGTHK
jgi:chromosome segregation ATPase